MLTGCEVAWLLENQFEMMMQEGPLDISTTGTEVSSDGVEEGSPLAIS
jgi:hypothetical protein